MLTRGKGVTEVVHHGLEFLTAGKLNITNDIVVLPCGGLSPHHPRMWTTQALMPYVHYMPEGVSSGRMFGGFLFKPIRSAKATYYDPLYAGFGQPAHVQDWAQWINELCTPGTNLHALAALSAFHKPDVWIALPYPHPEQDQFGKVAGKSLNFALTQDRITALQWWVDKFTAVWAAKSYLGQRMHLQGFVWPRASVYAQDLPVVRHVNQHVHALKLMSLWLPHYGLHGVDQWERYGFDAAAVDSNYSGYGSYNLNWLDNACKFAKVVRTGLQIVYGRGNVYSPNHFLDYLNGGLAEANGYMGDALKVYAFPNQTLTQIIRNHPDHYRLLYAFMKGQYPNV
jgi:hypothetical protein